MAMTRTRGLSKRFVPAAGAGPAALGLDGQRSEVFAEGGWPSIRVFLEMRGWSPLQIDQIHEQLRQGWPLSQAVRQVSIRMGTCPLRSKSLG
ncbi:hypothetical protein SynRS9915_00699 [Synechococcus sp. RS9915]|jgi:hypothetical protein|nr:hypothetical protein SynRS9915_00699 [Synechococcus sp. RS9915]QNJ13344.1 hypothetical protein SynA18461_00693 [Synechococcus sp. A18-46.1]